MPNVSITAIRTEGVDPSFDGVTPEPGVHVRVGFEHELGFPRGGIRLERRIWTGGQASGWAILATLCLPVHHADYPANGAPFPSEPDEARRRLERHPTGEQLTHYRPRYVELIDELRGLLLPRTGTAMMLRPFSGATAGDPVRIRALEGLLSASADPWFARILGLSYLDTLPSWTDVEYRATARWSLPVPTTYPDRPLDFGLVRRAAMTTEGRITIGDAVVRSDRPLQFLLPGEDGATLPTIRVGPGSGTPRPGLRLRLPSPVMRVAFAISSVGGAASPVWLARAHDGTSNVAASIAAGATVAITGAAPFTTVDLFDTSPANNAARWEITAIDHRTDTIAGVGDVVSSSVRVLPGAASRPRRPVIDGARVLATRPAVPIAEPLQEASRLELGATAAARIDDLLRPTRLAFRMSSAEQLRALWTLRESARDEVTGTAGAPPAGTPFQPAFSPGSRAPPEPTALSLGGAGAGVGVPFRTDLNSLGVAATITAWIHATGAGGSAFPCIVGNDYQIGYALCVEAATRRLRFSIAGASCFSATTTPLNRWDHVAVVYNGATATFYVNGRPDAPVPFARGAIPSNAGQPLGLGADPGATGADPSLLTWQGQLSEVTIHARVLTSSEIASLARREPVRPIEEARPSPSFVDHPVANLPLAGNALDHLSPVAPTTVGTIAWVAPAPGAPRTALSLSGTGFVQLGARPDLQDLGSGMVIRAWVRPDAGLSFPTLVGNAFGTSFWLGLDTSAYRPRLWVNGHLHVATTGIPAATWSHVVASYDGATVRFYVNGADAGVLPAAWGPVAPNPAGTMCIGADSGSTPTSVHYPFKGQLADVQILRRAPPAVPIERPATLFTEFRLDASPEDNTAELTAAAVPLAVYTSGSPEAGGGKQMVFDGTRFLAFQTATRPVIADGLTVQAWVRPEFGVAGAQTLVGASSTGGWWVGLEATTYKVRFERQGVGWSSSAALVANRWNHVAVSYDGRRLSIYIDGRFDAEHVISPAQGGALAAGAGTVNVAADAGSAPGALIRPLRGGIAGLRIWRVPIEPLAARALPYDPVALHLELDGQAVDLSKGKPLEARGAVAWAPGRVDSDTRLSLHLTGTGYLDATNRFDLEPASTRGAIEAVVRIDDATGGTVVDDGGVARLEIEGGTRRARFVLGGTTFTATTPLIIGAYQRVLVSFDGANVRFHTDGVADGVFASALGRATNPTGRIAIGARVSSTPASPVAPFRGRISEVTVLREAVTPAEARATIAGMRPGAEQIVDGVDNRTWLVRARGANVFGHTSDWSPARVVAVRDATPPVPPVSVRVSPVALRGPITLEAPGILRIAVRPPSSLPDLARHVVTIRRDAIGGGRVLRERFAIASASASGPAELRLVLAPRPFARLAPITGDHAVIDVDARVAIGLEWPGVHRVLSPRTRELRVYRRLGNSDVLTGRVASAPVRLPGYADRFAIPTSLILASGDLAPGRPVQIGTRIFRAVSPAVGANATIVVDHEPRPVVAPAIGDDVVVVRPDAGTTLASPLGYPGGRVAVVPLGAVAVLRSGGIFSVVDIADNPTAYADLRARRPALPETWSGPLYRTAITGTSVPSAFQSAPVPDAFVPGALHAIDVTASIGAWAIFATLWHAYDPATGSLTVWFAPRGEAAERLPVTRIAHPRLYLGERIDVELDVPVPTPAQRTLVSTFGVSAADDRIEAPDVFGDPGRYGLESAVGGPAEIASVARAAPPRATAPTVVSLSPADFYGDARATVAWTAGPGAASYRLLRAIDTAIFQRDLEQRRARSGTYDGGGSPPPATELLGEDVVAWCAARFPGFDVADLFVAAGHAAYPAASEVWRAWAARFYPALDRTAGPSQLAALADRQGNDRVFVPIAARPTSATSAVDDVPGYALNRFVYRVVALSGTLQPALDPSPSSEPTPRAPRVPLRAPVIHKVYAADRAIRVEWTLEPSPAVRGYRLFRAEDPDDLFDLRLAAPADERLVADLPDPQLRVQGGSIALRAGTDLQTEVRVYRRDEFVYPVPTTGLRPYDHFPGGSIERAGERVTLHLPALAGDGARIPIPPGTAVVVAFRDSVGEERIAGAENPLPYVDTGREGLVDYHYRVQSYDDAGNVSPGSNLATGRAVDYSLPDPPPWTRCERDPADPPGSIRAEWQAPWGSRCIVVRSSELDPQWRPISEWIPSAPRPAGAGELTTFSYLDTAAPAGTQYSYRIRMENRSGNTNRAYDVRVVAADS